MIDSEREGARGPVAWIWREAVGRLPKAWRGWTASAGAVIVALDLLAQMIAFGANGTLLALIAALANMAAAFAVVLLLMPDRAFWRATGPVLILCAAILLWLALPLWAARCAATSPACAAILAGQVAPDLRAAGVVRACGLMALLLAGACIGYRRGVMRIAIDWVILLGGVEIAFGLILWQHDPEHVFGASKGINIARFTGTLLNANAAGCLFGMLSLLACGRLLVLARERYSSERGLGVATGGCLLLGIGGIGGCAISGSRTAFLLTLLLLIGLCATDPLVKRRALHGSNAVVTGGVLIVLAIVIVVVGLPAIERLAVLGDDGLERVLIWQRYLALAFGAPAFGYGLGAFSDLNLLTLSDPVEARHFWYINDAHNIVVQLVLEGGLGLLLLIAGLVGIVVTCIVRSRRREGPSDPLVRAIAGALVLVLGGAMVDIALDVPVLAALAVYLVALLWGRAVRAGLPGRSPSLGGTVA